MILLYLNDGLHYQSACLQDIEGFRFLAYVVDDIIGMISRFIKLLVKIDQVNKAPIAEEW